MLTGTVNFNHKNGCLKCEVTGEYDTKYHHMSYPDLDAPLRNNESFRQRTQAAHHKYASPFEDTNIDMVRQFTVADPLHLLHHGVTKKCIERWIGKVKGYSRKWDRTDIETVSEYLLKANERMPSDIHRSLRSLNDLSKWKGVEFRTFLMYIGIVALRPVLQNDEYEHFLLLWSACTIVSCNFYKTLQPRAKGLFKLYVVGYMKFYGRHSVSSNVHNLIHIADELLENDLGSIDEISTYKYENSLRLLSMKLKNCNRPLQQISRRLLEIFNLNMDNGHPIEVEHAQKFSPIVEYELSSKKNCFTKITIKPDVFLSSRKLGDQWFLTSDGDIVKMIYATKMGNSYKVCGNHLITKGPFFSTPFVSTDYFIFMSDGETSTNLCMHEVNSIRAKMICLEIGEKFVFMPLLHTLEILNK